MLAMANIDHAGRECFVVVRERERERERESVRHSEFACKNLYSES